MEHLCDYEQLSVCKKLKSDEKEYRNFMLTGAVYAYWHESQKGLLSYKIARKMYLAWDA